VTTIREKAGVHKIFEGFEVDDFAFDPCGYSLNALRGKDYYTIHVTPEEQGSYVSFETNVNLDQKIDQTLHRVLEVFQPNAFDVIVFRPKDQSQKDHEICVPGYNKKTTVNQALKCGYDVSFTYHYRKNEDVQNAIPIEDF
jgi:S-adenosylmethionine decarboxylase